MKFLLINTKSTGKKKTFSEVLSQHRCLTVGNDALLVQHGVEFMPDVTGFSKSFTFKSSGHTILILFARFLGFFPN